MSRFALLAGGGASVAAAAAAVVYVVQTRTPPEAPPEPQPVVAAPVVTEPQTEPQEIVEEETTAAAEPEVVEAPAQEPILEIVPPRFDVVRVEPNGQTLIAGSAMSGALVELELDGALLAEPNVGDDGKFVQFADITPSERPRVLTIAMMLDGERIAGEGSIIIAPIVSEPEAEVIAEAENPEPSQEEEVETSAAPEAVVEQPVVEAETEVAEPLQDETPTQEVVVSGAEGVEDPEPFVEVARVEPEPTEEEVVESDATEVATPTVLATDEEGLRVLQAPQITDTIALDTISYDAEGQVALAGRASNELVRVYLDNTPVTTTVIRPDGSWRAELPEVDRGVYTLRVDEIDAKGEVASRVETPFKREDREVLAAADVTDGSDDAPARVMTVQPGNTLWAIAREQYGDGTLYVRLFEANKDKIRDPDLIYPGQVFGMPE